MEETIMLSSKKKSNVVIMAMIILLSIIMVCAFCNFNVASAEEATDTNVVSDIESYAIDLDELKKDTLNVGVKGTLADGERTYGGYFMEVCVKRLDNTTYKISTLMQVNALRWKTDRYKLISFSYRFYGENIQLTSRSYTYGTNDDAYNVNKPEAGFEQINFSYNKSSADNFAWIKEEITAKADGTAKFCMEFNGVKIDGIAFAKNTTINSPIAKVRVQPSTLMGMYQPFYAYSGAYVSGAAYTTQFGPVPSDWKISANISAI